MNPDDFVLSVDYTTDKVIYSDDARMAVPISVGAGATVTYSQPHGINFLFLPEIVWSLTPDFATSYTGTSFLPTTSGSRYYDVRGFVGADGTNIDVAFTNLTGSTVNIYLKVYGLYDDSLAINNGYSAPQFEKGNIFLYNTDYLYDKIFVTGTQSGNGSVAHGYTVSGVPTTPSKVKVWYRSGSTVFPSAENNFMGYNPGGSLGVVYGVSVNTTDIVFNEVSPPTAYIYRVYT